MVEMTPDPRLAVALDRPIPAEPIVEALRAEGYSVMGARRERDGLTHAALAERSELHRRTIGRICDGTRTHLSVTEAEAILDAIDRDDLHRELVGAYLDERAKYERRLDEELDAIYEEFWIALQSNPPPGEDWQALSDQHLLHDHWQNDDEIKWLPFGARRRKTHKWFSLRYNRRPHPIPQSLRERALRVLATRREECTAAATRARTEIGPPESITAGRVRDVTHRARDRGLIEHHQRPRTYASRAG
jgi:hypothetical protein